MKKKLSFSEFHKKVFPFKTAFEREEYGFITNLIKFMSLRVAYLLYRLNISANILDAIASLSTIPAFVMVYTGLVNLDFRFFLFGYSILAAVIFIDFFDGLISKTHKYIFKVGAQMDNLGPDIVMIGGFFLIGIMTQNIFLIVLNSVNAVFLISYKPSTIKSIPLDKEWLFKLYSSRFSLFSLRVFSAGIFPLLSILYIQNQFFGKLVAAIFVLIYFVLSVLWLKASWEDRELR